MELRKGHRVDLGFSKFMVGLGWDPSTSSDEDFDLDVSAFILGANKKVLSEKHIVYYNSDDRILPEKLERGIIEVETYSPIQYPNYEEDFRVKTRPVSPNFEVIGSLDDKTGTTSDGDDDEDMYIDLSKIDKSATEIVIVVSIYDADERRQNFGQVRNSYIRVLNTHSGEELFKYELDEDFFAETAVEFGRIYQRDGNWRFEALGSGTKDGLGYYVEKYHHL
jgi:tellurium resistance protein TerD